MIKFFQRLTCLFLACSCVSAANISIQSKPISDNEKKGIIKEIINLINANYVFPDVAKKIQDLLDKKQYNEIKSSSVLAKQLTQDIQNISHDKHLQVIYSSQIIPKSKTRPSISEELKKLPFAKKSENFGFQEIKHLKGNIGYLSFNFFAPPEIAGRTAASAMYFLSNTDALIIDLRDNHGGDPAMVSFLATYFFSSNPVHLNDLYWRGSNTTQQFWTLPYVPGKRYLNKNVYILTSRKTFSGAEEFAYDLKNLKRAVIIGEATAGGANPSYVYRINAHFQIWIPGGRAINPITKTNWENVGVKPDLQVPQSKAFKTAYILSLKNLIKKTTTPDRKAHLLNIIKSQKDN